MHPKLRFAAATKEGDLTRLACLWSQQELCGRRPAKYDPLKWACKGRNVDSFLLYVRLKRLPKVPTFADAVAQQRQVTDDEAKAMERIPAGSKTLQFFGEDFLVCQESLKRA